MKTLLITSFLTLAASLAYAGGSCCEKKVDTKDKDTGKSDVTAVSTPLACSGDHSKDSKDTDAKSGYSDTSAVVAGSDCSGDKCEKDTKSKAQATSVEFAGAGCGGDKGDKKCEKKVDCFTGGTSTLA